MQTALNSWRYNISRKSSLVRAESQIKSPILADEWDEQLREREVDHHEMDPIFF